MREHTPVGVTEFHVKLGQLVGPLLFRSVIGLKLLLYGQTSYQATVSKRNHSEVPSPFLQLVTDSRKKTH